MKIVEKLKSIQRKLNFAIAHLPLVKEIKMRDLSSADAKFIYDILMDSPMAESVKAAMKTNAESSMGMFAMVGAWFGTEVPPEVLSRITPHFYIQDLHNKNLMALNGDYIELNVLASAMPKDILMSYFKFDMEAKAKELNTTLEHVRDVIRKNVKGYQVCKYTGENQVVFSKNFLKDDSVVSQVVGIGGMAERDDICYTFGKLAYDNIKKLMEDDKVFNEKFDLLKDVE